VPIPMSADAQRQRQNLDVFGFTLTEQEMATLSGMQRGRMNDQDPDVYEEF
jgi:2,5-diketo-D-gluconate reductase A